MKLGTHGLIPISGGDSSAISTVLKEAGID